MKQKVYLVIFTWIIDDMKKAIFMFNSDRLKAKEQGVDDTWFTVINDENNLSDVVDDNPWNQDLAEIKKNFYC